MKYMINTQLTNNDLKLAKSIVATSSFETVANYFVYVLNNLTSNEIINPIENAGQLIADRTVQPLLINKIKHVTLIIDKHELNASFLRDLAITLQTNTFWTIDKIFDYMICQLITNPEHTFSFNFNEHDQLLIEGVESKDILAQLNNLAIDSEMTGKD